MLFGLIPYTWEVRKLVLFGDQDFADIAFEYFTHDSDYEVIAFTVNRQYIKANTKFGLPVIPFEDILQHIDPSVHSFYAAVTYNEMNRIRKEILNNAIKLGFTPASYISSKAFVWRNTQLGSHVFVFEDNTIQPFSKIGDNVVLWSGNHIGHHSVIGANCFLSSHVVVSGRVIIGDNCFLGVNSTIANGTVIEKDCWINSHSFVSSDVLAGSFVSNPESGRSSLDRERLERALKNKSILRLN
jgi:sugar O-acyltransferase (sialic acid O-acetyltransferase NeuD family)